MKFIDIKIPAGAGVLRDLLRRTADGSKVSHLHEAIETQGNAQPDLIQAAGASTTPRKLSSPNRAVDPAAIYKFDGPGSARATAEQMQAMASRTPDATLFASRAQIRLEKAASYAEAAAALQGRTVKYTVDPEVSAFFALLSADDARSLKALTDALVSPKLTEHTEAGKFTLAMSPSFTERQRTAMFEALKLGGSPQALDAKLNPLELKPFST